MYWIYEIIIFINIGEYFSEKKSRFYKFFYLKKLNYKKKVCINKMCLKYI